MIFKLFLCLFILFIFQFIIFRIKFIYKISFITRLYDFARWVTNEPKILIMGSSFARHHFIPKIIAEQSKKYNYNEIYNIGNNSATPFQMYITFMKNKDKFKNLDLVYHTLDPHILGEKYNFYNKYEIILLNFKQWNYLFKKHKNYIKINYNLSYWMYFFPILFFFRTLEFNRPIFSGRNNGFDPLKHKHFVPTKENTIKKYFYEPLYLFPASNFQIYYLRKLKEEVEKLNSKFILVLTLSYSWYTLYKNEAQEYDKQLVQKLQKNLGYSIVIGSMNKDNFGLEYVNFWDDTHLCEEGAIKFTKQLFKNIDFHSKLIPKKIKPLYDYNLKE